MNKKRVILYILLYATLFLIMLFNSITIVEWLNRSLFVDYAISPDDASGYYFGEVLLVFLIVLLMYAIIGTFIVSILATNIIFGTLVIANHIKVQERNEFITFSELKTIASPKELLSFIDVSFSVAVLSVVGMLTLLIILQFTIYKVSKRMKIKFNKRARVALVIIPLMMLSFIYLEPNKYNELILEYEDAEVHNWNPVKRARSYGFIPTFLHTVKPNYQDKPIDYKKKHADDIEQKYQLVADEINKSRSQSLADSQTILYLSETLMDPSEVPGLLANETPIPKINEYMDENIGGTMYSQYIGGGTANIEWSILTSFSLEVFNDPISVTPYSDFYAESKNHQTILNYFDDEKIAIHPYSAHLYKRRTIYDKVGFNDFLYLDHGIQHTEKLGTHKRVSDEALNKDILRESKKAETDFLHVLTMQNHSPFTGEIPDMAYKPMINDIYPEDKRKDLYNYLQGLKASDKAVDELVIELESSDKEVNFLFYGDHFPSLFTDMEDIFPEEKLHETPWFLYMNDNRSESEKHYDNLSPMFFVPMLLKEGDYYVSPFQGLLEELLEADVRRIGKDFIYTADGEIADKDLPDDLRERIEDYRFIMYDALFGKNWLGDTLFSPPTK